MSSAETAISLEAVSKVYHRGEPVRALDGVSLSVPRGSYTAIMGPSGSGKSTLMNLVGCLDTPSAGRVVVDGRDVGRLSDRERTSLRGNQIGFVFQTFNLMPRLSALENVALPQVFRGIGRRERIDRARTLLERVGLSDRVDHRPSELSGGQRQRVALARALVNDPALVLADEPSGNLDTETEADVLDLFEEFHRGGTTLVVVTHEPHVAERAERIVHLLDGRIERIERTGEGASETTIGRADTPTDRVHESEGDGDVGTDEPDLTTDESTGESDDLSDGDSADGPTAEE